MKKLLHQVIMLFVLGILQTMLPSSYCFAQYGSNDYVLATQAQVDAFDPAVLQGRNLVISGSDITNIDRLSSLVSVSSLFIDNNPLLTSLSPLSNIDSLYHLRINNNGALSTITGFGALHDVFHLEISGNVNLTSISGFNAVQKLGMLIVSDNAKLANITGFQHLTTIKYTNRYSFGNITITNNPELTNFDGLLSVKDVDYIDVSYNAKLRNLHGLSGLRTISGMGVNFSHNAVLEDFDALANTVPTVDPRISGSVIVYLDHNPLLTKPCGVYQIIDKFDYLLTASRVNIEGSGFHMYQLIECGATRLTIQPAALVALNFNETSGTAISNTGTINATFSRSAGTPQSSTNVPANAGGSNSIDFGTTTGNYYVEGTAPLDGLRNLNGFTLTGWLNCKSNVVGSGGNRIVSWINNGGEGVDLVYQSNGSLRLGVDGWPDNSPAFSSSGKIPTSASGPTSNWRFFAVTYQSNGQVQFYFGTTTADATLDVIKTYPGPGVTGSAIGKLAIGAFNDATRGASTYNRMFRGLIDEVQIYNSVLDYEKILAIQHAVGSPTPTKPVITLVSKTSNSATLKWTPSTGAFPNNTYEFYKNGTLMTDGVTLGSDISNQATITGLSPNTTYTFAIKATDILNNSVFSDPITVNTNPASLLRLEAESYNGGNGIVRTATTVESTDALDWIRFDNVNLGSGYNKITTRYAKGNNVNGSATVRLGNPTSGALIGTLTTSYTGGWGTFATTQATLNGASGLQTVYVSWPSGEGNGNYDWFEFSNGTSDTMPPTAPSNLKIDSQTANSVTMSWTAATDNVAVTRYEVYNNLTQLLGTSATTSITLSNLSANTTYGFSVRAFDAAGNISSYSNTVAFTLNSPPVLRLEAESYNAATGIVRQANTVESTDASDWIRFDNVNLSSGYTTITTRYAKGNSVNGTATVRLENPTTGTLLGTLTTTYTGGWGMFATASAPLTGANGLHTLYVTWPTGEGNGNFDWFEFSTQSSQSASARENMPIAPPTVVNVEIEFENKLLQNYPNPFSTETEIGISLDHNVKVARIAVRDVTGRTLHDIEVVTRGKTSVTVSSETMNSGFYFYSLTADGKVVDSKRMVLIR
ncbi:carbohydrate-binding protein [Chryseolinea sp. T2]|uniref:carbohydrate-binding protein n=1 Tax=Chryseolinea sp. T2 TaxID=3129255 RepID=UPI0030783BE5